MDKVKKFIYKYKIPCTIALLLVASFSVYFFVFANEDIYENQIEVKQTSVEIIDGIENIGGGFDADNNPGNDSANNNKIVRNFDSIIYNLSYTLGYKESSTLDPEEQSTSVTRNVIIDVLVPANLSVTVSEGEPTAEQLDEDPKNITIDDKEYILYKFYQNDRVLTEANNVEIRLSDINSKNGKQILPIIRIREATDSSQEEINNNTSLDELKKVSLQPVVVSAKKQYEVKLYQGVVDKNVNVSTFPVGILVYVPFSQVKGIKGIEIPESINFDMTVESDIGDSQIIFGSSVTEDNPKISNYDSEKYAINALAPSRETGNGLAGFETTMQNNNNKSVFNITIDKLNFNKTALTEITDESENTIAVNYLSSKMFVFKTQRKSNSKKDIIYNISIPSTQSIQMVDNYEPFVGDFLSKIDFINQSKIEVSGPTSGPTVTKSGEAIYNYNEEFYIQDTINYGLLSGDTLQKGFTNYIKVDNSAIKVVDIGSSDQSKDYYVEYTGGSDTESNYDATVEYGIGEWNASYFKVKDAAPSYCPTNLNLLSKEDLMNYYGGPCIEENENVKWFDSIYDAASEDEQNRNKIIIVKFNMNSEYKPGVTTTIRLRAQAIKNPENVGKTFQVVSRGKTIWKKKNTYYDHYLSETSIVSVADMSSDPLTYTKTIYSNGEISQINSPLNKYGNTILISPFKASINTVDVYDVYDSKRDSIYSGINDPMKIVINPVIYKSDPNATITGAYIDVYLPNTIEIEIKKGDKTYSSSRTEVIDGVNYNVYSYSYSEDDIKYENESASGTIPNLIIHGTIKIDTLDMTPAEIKAIIYGRLKPNTNAVTTYSDVTPISQRTTTKNITLRNTRKVSSVGKTNVLFIDKNMSYSYNMRAVNVTSEIANLEMLSILPYSGDGVGTGSQFSGNVSASINGILPSGYTAYYTTDNPKTLLSNELSAAPTTKWIPWTNYNSAVDATAIKVVPNSGIINSREYFAGSQGISITINTTNNEESDIYANNFYIIQKNAEVCVSNSILNDNCDTTELRTVSYVSNISYVSVYNRTISGMIFEDLNSNGLSADNEKRMNNLPVELYKLKATEFESKNPRQYISEEDELIAESITERKGSYKFSDLKSGNYYVKYMFDCDKYTVTEKNKQDPNVEGDTSLKDSDADMVLINSSIESEDEEDKKEEKSPTCYAVSNIIKLDDVNVTASNIDLGLRLRQEFDIKLRKYINSVVVNSNSGSKTYNYKNQSKVKIDIRNLKNTTFRVTYGIELENSKYFPGTIGNIVEKIPENMTFNPDLPGNDGWYESEGMLYYTNLNKTLIRPGEKYHITIVLDLATDNGGDYINLVAANNLQIMKLKTNFIEPQPEIELEATPDEKKKEKEE